MFSQFAEQFLIIYQFDVNLELLLYQLICRKIPLEVFNDFLDLKEISENRALQAAGRASSRSFHRAELAGNCSSGCRHGIHSVVI